MSAGASGSPVGLCSAGSASPACGAGRERLRRHWEGQKPFSNSQGTVPLVPDTRTKETDIIVLTATQVLLCHLSKCLLLQTILFSKRALHQQSSPARCSGRRLVVFSYFQSYGNLSIQRISQGTLKHVTKWEGSPVWWGTGALGSVGPLDHPAQSLLVAWRHPLKHLGRLKSRLVTSGHGHSKSLFRFMIPPLHRVGS